jgi:Cys-rich repeat protein
MPATPFCSQDQARCVQCRSKTDCAAGQQCKGGACQ